MNKTMEEYEVAVYFNQNIGELNAYRFSTKFNDPFPDPILITEDGKVYFSRAEIVYYKENVWLG